MEATEKFAMAAEVDTTLDAERGPLQDTPATEAAAIVEPDGDASTRPVADRSQLPPPPESLEEAGLSEDFVGGLILKALNIRGAALGFELVDMLALPMALLDEVIQHLQEQRLVEVHSTKGPRRGEWAFKLTNDGRKRAAEEFEICRYVGPAPVPFDDFCRWVEYQTIEGTRMVEEELRDALEGVVVPDSMLELLGPALNSGRSLFLFGDPGNGKTFLAERIARILGARYFVPYAVIVDGSVMILHDPVHHGVGLPESASDDGTLHPPDSLPGLNGASPGILRAVTEHDPRYAEARRPVVVTGGELTLHQLDLRWDPTGRMYQAPPQLKAAGGVLVVDDLGRQRVPVRDLLNRWVVPLEQRRDYLTLRSGKTIVVPFDCFVIFSTNLEPLELGDEAFLRRIHYKIHVGDPDRGEYERIFRACCDEREIPFDGDALDYLFEKYYGRWKIHPRRCHPRDVLDHVRDLAAYRGEPAGLTSDLLEQACRSYFLPSQSDSDR